MSSPFTTDGGVVVPTVRVEQMREVDRIAVENAGRAWPERPPPFWPRTGPESPSPFWSARAATVEGERLRPGISPTGAATSPRLSPASPRQGRSSSSNSGSTWRRRGRVGTALDDRTGLILDALLGYGLHDEPRGVIAEMISDIEGADAPVISLDVPSGRDGDTGRAPGPCVTPTQTLTLALPNNKACGGGHR